MPRLAAELDVQQAAARWRDRCLLSDGSILSERHLWTPENVAQLDRHFVQNLDEGEGGFWDKLKDQLAPATPASKQLAAEMFWVLYLIVYHESMRGETKRLQIRRVWDWSGEPLPENADMLGSVLDHGIANPGTSYNTHRWREFKFLIELMQAFKAMGEPERRALLSDPIDFGSWVDSMEESRGRQFRHALLYLLFPEHYDPIVTSRHKRDIVRRFRLKWGEDPDAVDYKSRLAVDREIVRIRERIAQDYGDRWLHFYLPPLVDIWRPETDPTIARGKSVREVEQWYRSTFGDARTWALAAGQGARAWGEFQRESIVAIGWDYLGDLTEYESREAIQEAIAAREGGNPTVSSLACWQFAHDMKVGDNVLIKRGRAEILGWGVIRSEYRHEPNRAEFDNVRDVEWRKIGSWTMPPERSITLKTLTDFTQYKEWLFDAWELIHGGDVTIINPEPRGKYTLADAADGLFMGPEKLRAILDTLARRKNVILQGPPGVGKTFVARRVAYALIGDRRPDQVGMIQFHQSYSYEDFVQGWRPAGHGGFERHDGVFHRFCCKAAANPAETYVFIIDEINRGNLSKVLGEVMMLIEADKRGEYAVPLTYSPETAFSVPRNLYVIGLMNTADRSLAMVDYALRRRFGFVSLEPAFESDAFSDSLAASGAPEQLIRKIVERISALNEEIRSDRNLGRGFEIGHSFFVPQESEELLEDTWYESVIAYEIRPLLEEYWFDDPDRVEAATRALLQ
jgi:5-methylcytosine-specific restriction protein B